MDGWRKSLRGWVAAVAVLALSPLPFVAVWSLLDGLQFWYWCEAARTAVLAYLWELGGVALLLLKDRIDDHVRRWSSRQR